jgi:hypothetical protein
VDDEDEKDEDVVADTALDDEPDIDVAVTLVIEREVDAEPLVTPTADEVPREAEAAPLLPVTTLDGAGLDVPQAASVHALSSRPIRGRVVGERNLPELAVPRTWKGAIANVFPYD